MEWIAWMIPLIVVAVVILSSLSRSLQETKRPPQPREKLPPRGRSSAEVERFLEELNRRRQQQPPPQAIKEAVPIREIPAAPPRPLPPPLPEPPVVRVAPPPAPVAVQAPGSVPELVPVAQLPGRRRETTRTTNTSPLPSAAVMKTLASPSLKELLNNPQLVRSAMVLREVLDPPLSRRQKRFR